MAKKKPSAKKPEGEDNSGPQLPDPFSNNIGDYFARVSVSQDLLDPKKREKLGLPADENEQGPYIIELNVQHVGSLPGAANDFLKMFAIAVGGNAVRISKSYYRCRMNVPQWRTLLAEDCKAEKGYRSIYKLWPDFPIKAQIDRSISTVKADAAQRAFDAGGGGIVWAVIDSGIDKDHPHFGQPDDPNHLLTNSAVKDLHRYFAYRQEVDGEVVVDLGPLESPDLDPSMDPKDRVQLLDDHRKLALSDDLGHGTHVAGIIAGSCPVGATPLVMEREFKPDGEGKKIGQDYKVREVAPRADLNGGQSRVHLSGVAPQCQLISLRVLNDREEGRVSSVITAMDYIREHLNDNPKVMRVHGVNLSVGYDFDAEMFACGQSPVCVEVNRLVQSGVVVVAAAGNTGFGSVAAQVGGTKVGLSNTINDPGNADLAITVGSTHRDMPHTYGVSFFSSKGPTGDGRLKPDLVAPGERITSCAAGSKRDKAIKGLPGGKPPADDQACYIDDSGTSMAAPHVSGAIAAFLSIRREFIGKPLEVKRIFLESATPLGRERYFEGHGLVDLMRAIQSV